MVPPFTLPHSTVAGIYLGAAAVVACNFPVVVGTAAAGAVVGPSGIHYVLAAVADIAVVVVVGSAVAASVDAIAAWGISGSAAVVAVAASCVVPSYNPKKAFSNAIKHKMNVLYCFSCGYDVDHDGSKGSLK